MNREQLHRALKDEDERHVQRFKAVYRERGEITYDDVLQLQQEHRKRLYAISDLFLANTSHDRSSGESDGTAYLVNQHARGSVAHVKFLYNGTPKSDQEGDAAIGSSPQDQ